MDIVNFVNLAFYKLDTSTQRCPVCRTSIWQSQGEQ